MKRVIFSPAARTDLDDIWDYTADRWDEAQAERYLLAIRDVCDQLVAGKLQSRSADEIKAGYRKAAVGSHVLFFRLTDTGNVDIVRVLHQRMDVAGQLGVDEGNLD